VADRVAHKEFPGIDVYAYESTLKQLDPENRGARCVSAIKAPM
jgi:hypothetical protein